MLFLNNDEEIEQPAQSRALRVGIVAPNGSHALDISGAIDAFNTANQNPDGRKYYKVDLIGVRAGPIVTSCGIRMLPGAVIGPHLGAYDTILVVGCDDPAKVKDEHVLLEWL
jgi:transcriptional regulator GlxA family with amidase domain